VQTEHLMLEVSDITECARWGLGEVVVTHCGP